MSKLSFTKKSLFVLVLAIAFVFSQFAVILTSTLFGKSFAETPSYYSKPVTSSLENANLSEGSGSKYPQSPSDWSEAENSSSSKSVNAGIVSTNNKEFTDNKKDINLTENPKRSGSSDEGVLMIQAKNGSSKYGYKNSRSVSLNENSYYKIIFWMRTIDCDGASVYLNISENDADNFVAVTSDSGNWSYFTYYIQTNNYDKESLSMELWLGSKSDPASGTVLFDDISIEEVTNTQYIEGLNTYNLNIAESGKSKIRIIDLKDNNMIEYSTVTTPTGNIQNGDFETFSSTDPVGFKVSSTQSTPANASAKVLPSDSIADILKQDDQIDENADTFIGNNFMYSNKNLGHALLLNNVERAVTGFESTTNFTIKQHGYYRISVYAKTGNLSNDGATITLTEVLSNEEIENGAKPLSTSITGIDTSKSDTGLPQYNGFQEYSFYVYGNPYKDIEVSISFSLGSIVDGTTTKVSGYAIFDDISFETITAETYNSKASGNFAKSFEFHEEKDTSTIYNGAFNVTANKEANNTYPLAPKKWTASEDNCGGIINVNRTHFNNNALKYGLEQDENPGPATTYPGAEKDITKTVNNVLMVRNTKASGSVSFESDTFSLSSATSSNKQVIKVVVYVKTLSKVANSKGIASIAIQDKNGVSLVSINNITSSASWTPYTLYLKNTCATQTLKLVLSADETGYAFFDYITHSTLTMDGETPDETEESLKEKVSSTVAYTDLENDGFYTAGKEISTNLYTPASYVNANETLPVGSSFGVIDTTCSPYSDKVTVKESSTDKNVLMIKNSAPSIVTLKSALEYSFSAGSYYKVSVWVYAKDISTEDGTENYGAYLELIPTETEKDEDGNEIITENTNIFKNIKTDSDENNGWVEYCFYVFAEATKKVQLNIGLGSENNLTQGYAFFDDITITDITEETYNELKEANAEEATTLFSTYAAPIEDEEENEENKPEEENPEDEEESSEMGINYWLLVPSVILAITLLIAIIGFVIKKVPTRNFTRRRRTEKVYDRKSFDEDLVKEELKKERDEKVAEIDNKIATLQAKIDKDKKHYEEEIDKAKSDDKSEKLLTQYAKERTKAQKEIDNLNSAKAFILDPANVKAEEQKEIKHRKRLIEEENKQIKKNLAKKLNESVSEEQPAESNKKGKK